ncbi:MAG: DUF2341 domain-containing protein [Planctomycetes bacterium]|nr:DUF2341 domain-containing protein [Planctomycetota bacterium]
MTLFARPLLVFALAATFLPPDSPAQEAVPDLTRGGERDRHHDWLLGPTGARGWIYGRELETIEARQILITAIEPGSPAEGVLAVGDVILGVEDQPFQSDARFAFGAAITRAETEERGGRLPLLRWREGSTANVELRLEVLGTYSETAPANCPKSQRILARAARHLAERDLGDGVEGVVNALALLATGLPEHRERVRAVALKLVKESKRIELEAGMYAWTWGLANLLLCELYLLGGDPELLPAIRKYSSLLARGQSAVGTWGHGLSLPEYRGGLGGYGAVNQAGFTCWLSLILAQRCGLGEAAGVVQIAIDRGERFCKSFAERGSVPYGDHAPYIFVHDNNGKNGEAALALDLLGDHQAARWFARMSTASYAEREMGHTGNYFGYLWGPLGVARCGDAALAAHLKEQRSFYDLARRWDGGFAYQGGAAAEDSFDGWDATGVFLLTYALPLRKLLITGRENETKDPLSGAELAETIAAGRDFDARRMNDAYIGHSEEQLLQELGSWSPAVRYRAASALARKKAPVEAALVQQLASTDRHRLYGACQAIELLGRSSAAGIDALIALLAQRDEWLQIRAAFALAGIGEPARKAVPALLELALAGTPGDSRERKRGYLGLALFSTGYIEGGPSRGLLARGLDDVDRSLLLPLLRLLLASDDGFMRSQVGGIYKHLRDEDLAQLWPAILAAVEQPAPSGEMFANDIRMAGVALLAARHMEEGLPAALQYARRQNSWASEIRMPVLMKHVASYGRAAQPFLPELRELAAYFRVEPDFPEHCRQQKVSAVEEAIRTIEAATTQPELRRIEPPYTAWKHRASFYLLTTPAGVELTAGTRLEHFPLLVRLHADSFDFASAAPQGEDLRFSDAAGRPLAYEIEEWDRARGEASIWVRVPEIRGQERQELHLHWGNPNATSGSAEAAVFNASNGFVSVWHLGEHVRDAVGLVTSEDRGTQPTRAIIGAGRRLDGSNGISGGDEVRGYPTGARSSSTSAWFRPERTNTTVIAWGKEQRPGKVMMNFLAPPRVAIQCYFADVEAETPLSLGEWVHVVHTYQRDDSRVYVNGVLAGASTPRLDIPTPVRVTLGGWHDFNFVGDLDELRIAQVVRSPEWIRLEHENQRPLQLAVGTPVQPGEELAVTPSRLEIEEGAAVALRAKAGGAQKVAWLLRDGERETLLSTDRFTHEFSAPRVSGTRTMELLFRAVYPQETKTLSIAVIVRESRPAPEFKLEAPARWDGRTRLELTPQLLNAQALPSGAAQALQPQWSIEGPAVLRSIHGQRLVLERALGSGTLQIALELSDGAESSRQELRIEVEEPASDAWVERVPEETEHPEDHQFYARDDRGEGTLHCRGTLDGALGEATMVTLRIFMEDRTYAVSEQVLRADRRYAFAVRLKPGLVRYRSELVLRRPSGEEIIVSRAADLVCGDALLVMGQSNAEATDVGPTDPPFTSEWIRSFGSMAGDPASAQKRGFGPAVCRDREGAHRQIGYWALELARGLVDAHQIPICIVNGAVGGTRIDQHQRNEADPTDLRTIYGRVLTRLRAAKLTHGIRAVIWHQGENDQGADGPNGKFGWETYTPLFLSLAAAWKQDYPNLHHTYVFQIWPKACAMGWRGSDDKLREEQRRLPRYISRLHVLSTLGIDPPGGCHYPLLGYAAIAHSIQPLLERDLYGVVPRVSITPPDLVQARFVDAARQTLELVFDQPITWDPDAASELYLDAESAPIAEARAEGAMLTLRLRTPSTARHLTYVKGDRWSPGKVLRGANGIAALSFCEVAIEG